MLPNDDDSYEGDYVSLVPHVTQGKVPAAVIAYARSRLSNLILAGDGEDELHQAFHVNFKGIRYKILVRQAAGGYKLIFEGGGCSDKDAFLLVLNDGTEDEVGYSLLENPTDDDTFFAYYKDAVEEEIDPIEGQPRPEPETADRTKGYRVPPELRNAYAGPIDPDIPDFDPIGYLPATQKSASLFSGQMREAVQCYHARGRNSPFQHDRNYSHGILEYPNPRVVGADAAEERANHAARKFWIIEIGSAGVFARRTRNTKRCCDSWHPGYPVPDGSVVRYDDRFADDDEKVVKLLDDTDLTDITTDYFSIGRDIGWTFSYSGHEAQFIGALKDGSTLKVARAKIEFTVTVVDDEYIPSATFSMEESDVPMGSGAGLVPGYTALLEWGRGLDPTDLSFAIDNLNTWIGLTTYSPLDTTLDAPFHVFYDGNTERLFRCIWREETGGDRLREISVSGYTTLGGTLTSSVAGTVTTVTGSQAEVAKMMMYDRECVAVLETEYDYTSDSSTMPPTLAGTISGTWHIFGRSEHITLPTNVADVSTGLDAQSSPQYSFLFFMGGGLYYVDETMDPADQKTNKVYLAPDFEVVGSGTYDMRMKHLFPLYAVCSGGFDDPDAYPAGFVGRI